ncbi:MAG: Wzz/FepE/Etk N-terminal domain-containing protein [Capnocytophaga sp.]|nr:Wzz/FepE/Etk N-terminal domain-containing protein [Capnocytophaga sp.]
MEQKEEEIDLIALLLKIWEGRMLIFKYFIIFFVIGGVIAVFSPKEYTANSVVLPQSNSAGSLGSLGGLAAIAGVNINANNNADILPKLYPNIAQSIPFQKEMIKTLINVQGVDMPITYEEYYEKYPKTNILTNIKKYTIGLPGLILNSLKKSDKKETIVARDSSAIYSISEKEKVLFDQLKGQLDINYSEKEGSVTLSFSMDEPLAAAQMLKRAETYLQDAVTEFKIQKAKQQLDFIQKRYDEAEKDFKEKQIRLASFQDSNRGLVSSLPQTRLSQLQTDFNLAFNIYSELAKQLENQKIKVKEDTPVFTIIEPVSIPLERTKPKRGMIVAIWSFLGIVLGTGVIFIKDFTSNLKKEMGAKEE